MSDEDYDEFDKYLKQQTALLEKYGDIPFDFKCEGCGDTVNDTPNKLHSIGWDTPPFFTHTTCPTCPITVTNWWKETIG